jgi:mevalonate kinase
MQSVASAPGKAILFGEHAVVFGKPAIAFAVDKRATITIKKGNSSINGVNNTITFESPILNLKAELDLINENIKLNKGHSGIVKYVLEAVLKRHDGSSIDIILDMEMPIGAGLGSSAAVTVATLAALENYHQRDISVSKIAKMAHEIEIKVQGSASPLDTTISTFGGIIYLSENSEVIPLKSDLEDSIVIGYTSSRGNTGEMVAGVKKRRDSNPEIMDPVIDSIGKITNEAKSLLNRKQLNNEKMEALGELMNINHGLLDAIGVNTLELSSMVYIARKAGAIGSKITGAGGGGSMIALCNGNGKQVLAELKKKENATKADFSREGIIIHK